MRGLRIAAFVAAVPLAGCAGILDLDIDIDGDELRGSGYAATEIRYVGGFDQIEVHGVGRVIVEVGLEYRVEVTADDNILSVLESRVFGDRLVLGPESGWSLRPVSDIVYHVTMPALRRVNASGAVFVDVYDVDTNRLRVDMSGASRVTADGIADRIDLRLSGASHFEARDLQTFDAVIHASGAARATLWVRDYLEVYGSGAAEVRYIGWPEIHAFVSGAARVWRY